ncbi:MAG: hydantoinase/oxoprolinase family protein [Actinomycetota bacterium]
MPEPTSSLRIGIDVGGTNTDAVVLDGDLQLVGKVKRPTSADVVTGISDALAAVLDVADVAASDVGRVMLGTTHATNAVLERRELGRVAVIRIAGPATTALPPLTMWPHDLRNVVSAGEVIVQGGIEFDGSEHMPLDEAQIRDFLTSLAERPDAVAIVSSFAPVSIEHEERAAAVVADVLGDDMAISRSGSLGTIGLIERENATVLNGALLGVAQSIVNGLAEATARVGIEANTYFAQNDGTLMPFDRVLEFPVLTIGSGPANSMRGAAHLSSLDEAIVVDVGGTSTDIGVLNNGFPRESVVPVEIGGVRTNFRMPDLLAIALGGGTVVRDDEGLSLGPDSVGHRLDTEAEIFGGATTTLSDAAVAGGRASFGSATPQIHAERATAALARVDEMFADGIDRMKLSRSPRPVIAVGGGSVLVPSEVEGASEVLRPDHFDVANAIGAAIASVSADLDQLFSVEGATRDEVIAKAKAMAIDTAVALGADPDATEVVSIEELTMAYMTDNILRLRIKAAGPLQ